MKIKNINVHFTEAEIDKKIRELGARISEDYAGESVCLICILKGASFFTCELAKRITVPVEVEFMSVSSYGSGTESSGIVKIVQDLSTSIEGKNVIVVGHYRYRKNFKLPSGEFENKKSKECPSVYTS